MNDQTVHCFQKSLVPLLPYCPKTRKGLQTFFHFSPMKDSCNPNKVSFTEHGLTHTTPNKDNTKLYIPIKKIIPNSISLELRCDEGECGQWPLPLLFIYIYEKNKIKTLVHKRPSSSLQLVSHQNLSPRSFPCRKTYFGQDHRVPNSLQGEGNHSFLPQKSRRICTSLS